MSNDKSGTTEAIDVAAIGCGIAGMAASIHLARAGIKVACIEAGTLSGDPVGESLDWSAPDLLAELGLPMQKLLDEGIATYKRHIILKLLDGTEQEYIPGEWLGKPPYNAKLDTLHVDRTLLNRAIRSIMMDSGVQTLTAKVTSIQAEGRRIRLLQTAEGESIEARWYIDASGSKSSLLPRLFQLPFTEYGQHKVAIWDYFKTSFMVQGTTLHAFSSPGHYMEWIWKIPIRPDVVSVGYVAPGESVRRQRSDGESVGEIYLRQLGRFPELRQLVEEQPTENVRTTSFRCRVCRELAGPNWIVIGEAAAMVDPMTSNGVTAALRQAREAAEIIVRHQHRTRISSLAARTFSWRVASLACFFNCGIEKVIYESPIRRRIGIVRAGDVYTIPAWLMNSVYARLQPKGLVKTALYMSLLMVLRGGFNALFFYCQQAGMPDTVCEI